MRYFAALLGVIVVAALGSEIAYAAGWTKVSPVLVIFGTDGTDPQPVKVDSNGNVSVEFGASATAFTVGGPAADDAAASGNPVPFGCKHNTTANTVEDGDISYVGCTTRTELLVSLSNATNANTMSVAGADDKTNTQNNYIFEVRPYLFDGTTHDRIRQVVNATDSTGTGITAAGILAQYDDTTPTSITENQFGNLRMTATRGLLTGRAISGGTLENEFTCNLTAAVDVTAAATDEIVALSGSTVVRVCSMVLTVDTAATTAVVKYGTGTACDTGAVSLTGAMRFVDEGGMALSAGQGSLFRTAAGNALCITAATGAVTGFITYAQF